MSLYDMYFSTKNKNYMYDILSKVILKESGIQIVGDERYMNLYRLNYSSVFERVSTDELSELNKEIINHIGTLILNDIGKMRELEKQETERGEEASVELMLLAFTRMSDEVTALINARTVDPTIVNFCLVFTTITQAIATIRYASKPSLNEAKCLQIRLKN